MCFGKPTSSSSICHNFALPNDCGKSFCRFWADNAIAIRITVGILIEIPHVIRTRVRVRIPISHMLIKLDRRAKFGPETECECVRVGKLGWGGSRHTDRLTCLSMKTGECMTVDRARSAGQKMARMFEVVCPALPLPLSLSVGAPKNAVGDILKFEFPKQKMLVVFPAHEHTHTQTHTARSAGKRVAHASYAQFVNTEIGINGITRALRAVGEAAIRHAPSPGDSQAVSVSACVCLI